MRYGNYTPFNAYQEIEKKINGEILAEKESFVLGTSTDELTDYYFTNSCLTPLEIDNTRTETIAVKKEWRVIPSHLREVGYQSLGNLDFEFEIVIVTIPIKSHRQIEKLKQFADFNSYGNSFKWGQHTITIINEMKGYGFNKDEDTVKNQIENAKEIVYNWIYSLNTQISNLNESLKSNSRQWIELRKEKLLADQERYASLIKKINIPLRQKEDEVIKRIQVDQKPLIQRVRPTPNALEDYMIDRQKVLDIVHILDNQGRQFEKTPKSFQHSGEEDLRNVLLVGLNTVFEGRATGETFMAKGKTDIYLNIDKGNILVCECKIWGGRKLYNETIDQLLGYLSWRNNYGVIITFSKNKNLSSVLEESRETIRTHSSFKGSFQTISTTHFLSHHRLPADDLKNVEVHHLFYNLFIV